MNIKMISILKDKTFITLLLSIVLILCIGALRPEKQTKLYPKQYWVLKSQWTKCADMVFAGDSRVYAGISPEHINTTVANQRIFNFGYSANGYSKKYLAAIDNLIAPESISKTIVLGIAPHTLTEETLTVNGFTDHQYTSAYNIYMQTHWPRFMYFITPMSFKDIKHGLIPKSQEKQFTREYHANGWIASKLTPENTVYEKKYLKYFKENKVSDRIINNVIHQVKLWHSQGIKVYAFRPPASPNMIQIEDNNSQFNQDQFIVKLSNAGGIWLDLNTTQYHTFDASHLTKLEAIRFSQDIGNLISTINP